MKTTFVFAVTITMAIVVMSTPLAHAVDTTRAWDYKFSGLTRWAVLTQFNKEAVFDKETGLVWERSPEGNFTWYDAHEHCNNLAIGNRMGFRLPTIQELASLVDPSAGPGGITLLLPSGHPFINVQYNDLFYSWYWAATSNAADPTYAWTIHFGYGWAGNAAYHKSSQAFVWCVRGGQGVDPQ